MNETTERVQLGNAIRQMRRQQSLTQTELGGEAFSKSYVSGVECSKIIPSYEALHFFAEKLGQSRDFFEQFLPSTEKPRTAVRDVQTEEFSEHFVQEKIVYLLDVLLEGDGEVHLAFNDFSPLLPEVVSALTPANKGLYVFLLGLIAQQKEDFSTALLLLEQALGFVPSKYSPAVLDALGNNYYYVHSYYVAIEYHKRALTLLYQDAPKEDVPIPDSFLMKVELHCGNDYYALGAHHSAYKHFEIARSLLRSTHNMQTAAQLYLRLGYSIYTDIYQRTVLSYTTSNAIAEIEREFQRAISYFVQSRTLYQVSSSRYGEAQTRLSQAQVLLDLSIRRWQVAQFHSSTASSAVLLDEAEEQCRQILLAWEHDEKSITDTIELLLYTAIAYLIRVYIQRATIAHKGQYTETADRDRSTASRLCQLALDTFENPDFQPALLYKVLTFNHRARGDTLSLPRIPKAFAQPASDPEQKHSLSYSAMLFAAGEVSELSGRTTSNREYAHRCYEHADRCFNSAFSALQLSHAQGDKSFLYSYYQRYIEVLRERQQLMDVTSEQVNNDRLRFLERALYEFL